MKSFVTATAAVVVLSAAGVFVYASPPQLQAARLLPMSRAELATLVAAHRPTSTISTDTLTAVVQRTCVPCHNDDMHEGGMSLDTFKVAGAAGNPVLVERMISKLRAGMMPPPGNARPAGDTLATLATTLEELVDKSAATNNNPGTRTFQRLNRAEYERAIHDLLSLDVDAGDWLPLDTKSANFDNIADVQTLSATLLDAYLNAASAISRLAVGDPRARPTATTYKLPRLASQQWDHVDGAPYGTRGGIVGDAHLPGRRRIRLLRRAAREPDRPALRFRRALREKIDFSVNGERVALVDIDRGHGAGRSERHGAQDAADPVKAGAAARRRRVHPHVRRSGRTICIAPLDHSLADTQIGMQYGDHDRCRTCTTSSIRGPYNPSPASRRRRAAKRIFTCRPTVGRRSAPVRRRRSSRPRRRGLSPSAHRGETSKALMELLRQRRGRNGGFESGIRTALEAMLASPHFIFRVEKQPRHGASPAQTYAISRSSISRRACRSSSGARRPTPSCWRCATKGDAVAAGGVSRSRRAACSPIRASEALATRFAAQWLRLQDIDKVHPDRELRIPNFDQQLADGDADARRSCFFNEPRPRGSTACSICSAPTTRS